MSIISLIAAVDENNGIGYNNQLLCYLPADLQHFKKNTLGKPIIMGRKTFESIGKPLPGRLNIIISNTLSPVPGIMVCTSLHQALDVLKEQQEIMIIGGERLFAEAMPQASYLYITHIQHQFTADVFFPAIESQLWECIQSEIHPCDDKNLYTMQFCFYKKKSAV